MFSTNVNQQTGIRYGVIYANDVNELYHEILSCGESITYHNYQKELTDKIRHALTEEGGDLKEVLNDYYLRDRAQEYILESVSKHEGDWSEEEIDKISEQVMEYLNDSGAISEFDEEEYEYKTENEEYLLNYLGGAPMIWVLKSPVMTKVRLCSPCVPNAGDLNSPDPEDGYTCYAIEPDWFNGECPYEVVPVPESVLG